LYQDFLFILNSNLFCASSCSNLEPVLVPTLRVFDKSFSLNLKFVASTSFLSISYSSSLTSLTSSSSSFNFLEG